MGSGFAVNTDNIIYLFTRDLEQWASDLMLAFNPCMTTESQIAGHRNIKAPARTADTGVRPRMNPHGDIYTATFDPAHDGAKRGREGPSHYRRT